MKFLFVLLLLPLTCFGKYYVGFDELTNAINANTNIFNTSSNNIATGINDFQNARMNVGANWDGVFVSNGIVQANQQHLFGMFAPSFGSTAPDMPFLSVCGYSPTFSYMELGKFQGTTNGICQIIFSTGAQPTNVITRWWYIDVDGTFSPWPSTVANFGSAANPVNLGTFTTVKTTFLTNGTTVFVSSTNSAPPNNPNLIFVATPTNAQGWIFISSNGVWFRK